MPGEDKFSAFPIDMQQLCRLHSTPESTAELVTQVEVLRDMLLRAIQEIEALKLALATSGSLDSSTHRTSQVQTLLRDHSGAGASPWRQHSYATYILNEDDYLRALGLNDEEIGEFKARAQFNSNLT